MTGGGKLDISWPVKQFMQMMRSAENSESIQARHIKSTELPDEVFGSEEARPTMKISKKRRREATKIVEAVELLQREEAVVKELEPSVRVSNAFVGTKKLRLRLAS